MNFSRPLIILSLLVQQSFAQTNVTRYVTSPLVNEHGILKKAKAPVGHKITQKELTQKISKQKGILIAKNYKPTEAIEKSKIYHSIYDVSDVLSAGQYHTILPQNSILYFPEFLNLEVKLERKAGTKFLLWPEFLKRFSGLLEPLEISTELITGKESFPQEKVAYEIKKQKVIIAHYQGNPVSCRSEFKIKEQQ